MYYREGDIPIHSTEHFSFGGSSNQKLPLWILIIIILLLIILASFFIYYIFKKNKY